MRQDLQEKLFKDYPELFIQKDWDKTKTCMCWGVDTGNGWFKLLDELCCDIMTHCKETGASIPQFVQIKEKFGTLRVYTNGTEDEYLYNLIHKAEDKSATICEDCGDPGEIGDEYRHRCQCKRCEAPK